MNSPWSAPARAGTSPRDPGANPGLVMYGHPGGIAPGICGWDKRKGRKPINE